MTRRSLLAALVVILLGRMAASASAQSFVSQHVGNKTVVRVVEDWKLVVGDPDPNVTAPQVTTAFSPTGTLSGTYAIFNLNHQALETFAPGGMQLQIWTGENARTLRRIRADESFTSPGEEVTWTQEMTLSNNGLRFDIENGQSETWGSFGGGTLSEQVPTTLTNLNAYNPAVSLSESGVTFARNRVDELVLVRVHLHTSDGTITTVQLDADVLSQD